MSRFRVGISRSEEKPCAVTAVTSDDYGVVLLASPDGERYRTVERLAMTAAEAKALYEQSRTPILTADDLRHRYGEGIAKLSLGQG